jgi:pSer/pThr/pTyr-binding forkhead associated (FHA) protein
MKSELVPENGDPPIPITRDVTVVGRREFCDVQINHPGLSKRHCILVRTSGLLVVRDLASTNGTKVKGQKVRWAALLPGDRVSLGGYKVKVYLGPDNTPSPSETKTTAARPRQDEPMRLDAADVVEDDVLVLDEGDLVEVEVDDEDQTGWGDGPRPEPQPLSLADLDD